MSKKDKDKLKKKLHKLIDSIEDEHVLNVLNEDVVPYVIQNKIREAEGLEDDLTEEEQKRLDVAIKEADEGKTISYKEFKKRMDQWLTE
jgi:hypothetical protein